MGLSDDRDPCGRCLFGEFGETTAHRITVAREGDVWTFAGFEGDPDSKLAGTFTPTVYDELIISGGYPEDEGRTDGTHTLYVLSNSTLRGQEIWYWTLGDTCPNGEADVVANRSATGP